MQCILKSHLQAQWLRQWETGYILQAYLAQAYITMCAGNLINSHVYIQSIMHRFIFVNHETLSLRVRSSLKVQYPHQNYRYQLSHTFPKSPKPSRLLAISEYSLHEQAYSAFRIMNRLSQILNTTEFRLVYKLHQLTNMVTNHYTDMHIHSEPEKNVAVYF